jgi:hypothetical protein
MSVEGIRMTVPVFEEYKPAHDCPCVGCAAQRRELARGLPLRAGGHPAAHGARRALVLFTAAGVALGGTGAAAASAASASVAAASAAAATTAVGGGTGAVQSLTADPVPVPATPQGGSGPLHGGPSAGPGPGNSGSSLRETTRGDIIERAKQWVGARVPYSMGKYWSDGYRQDCSGFVSMAWNLAGNEWTGSLAQYGVRIARDDLQPGDILLFHNPSSPNKGSHVTIFGGWTDDSHSRYMAYEQTPPTTRAQPTPMAYWKNSDRYVPYRYRGLVDEGSGGSAPVGVSSYPGAKSFGPGANNKYVTRLGEMLIQRGGKRFYADGAGPRWSDADRRATQAFQQAQGWRGAEADGLPGPDTWEYLVDGLGKNIPAAGAGGSSGSPAGATTKAPAFPGSRYFRPGQSNKYVEQLGRQLVRKHYGKYYASGPGPRWTEADRRNVQAFQLSLGWRGSSANGYPGPETWRRLFA